MTCEDDDFARRMAHSGVPLIRSDRIAGIHQDHSREDHLDKHAIRFDPATWCSLRTHNLKLLNGWLTSKNPVANSGIDWGTEKAIVTKEIF
jgi:GT2 family glycosyltransferase